MPFSSAERTIWAVFMPPTLKKLRGILLWAFPPALPSITKIGFKNFIDKITDLYFFIWIISLYVVMPAEQLVQFW